MMEEKYPDEWLKNLPLQSEDIAFKPEEMIQCLTCARANPPTRLNCFYCGAELEIGDEQRQLLKLNLRKLEAWEKGFNLIFLPAPETAAEINAAEISRLLKAETEFTNEILTSKTPLPIARAESEKEAEITQTRLRETGVETLIVGDENLKIEQSPRRLRGIEFFDDKLILILFNQDEIVEIADEDLSLIVTGATFERRIEATEKYNKKGENKILETSETASDEQLIDLYSRNDSIGYRIWAKGFDFSCLDDEKGILATENIGKLVGKLRLIHPNVKLIDDYLRVRDKLSAIWEVEQKTDSRGLKREGFGKFNLGNLTTVNNLSQFTRYSRLQWHLL